LAVGVRGPSVCVRVCSGRTLPAANSRANPAAQHRAPPLIPLAAQRNQKKPRISCFLAVSGEMAPAANGGKRECAGASGKRALLDMMQQAFAGARPRGAHAAVFQMTMLCTERGAQPVHVVGEAGGGAGEHRAQGHAPIRSLRDASWYVADASTRPAKRPSMPGREAAGCAREGRRPLAELPHEGGDQVRREGGSVREGGSERERVNEEGRGERESATPRSLSLSCNTRGQVHRNDKMGDASTNVALKPKPQTLKQGLWTKCAAQTLNPQPSTLNPSLQRGEP